MNRFLTLLVLSSACIFLSPVTNAQSTCTQTLRTARSTYDQGRLHELPAILDACLRNGFTKQERVEAYKLLVLAYIYLEEPSKADDAMLHLLRTDPYFEINESADPAEFISLYRTFRTWPVYRFGAKVGVNATTPSVVSSAQAIEGASAEYTPTVNFQAGFVFEIPLGDRLTINPELYFQLRSFYFDSDLDIEGDLENSSEGKESQSWVSLPVSLQYNIPGSRLNPYVALGVSTDYLISDNLSMNRNRVNATAIPERSYDIAHARKRINISAVASCGIKLKLGGGYVVSELRFIYGITSINDETSTYAVNDYVLFDTGYADHIMKLNSLSVTAGYIYNVFNPKKTGRRK